MNNMGKSNLVDEIGRERAKSLARAVELLATALAPVCTECSRLKLCNYKPILKDLTIISYQNCMFYLN